MEIKYKKLSSRAVTPFKAHKEDAGFDLTATRRTVDDFGNFVYGTDLAIRIPDGFVGLLFQRSSVAKKSVILSNAVGVIDAGYTGEITLKFKPIVKDVTSCAARPYEVGEKIGQLIIIPIPEVSFNEVEDLGDSERGSGNYGSSGK